MTAPGFFVTGTDTGVGKTVAACGLIRALRSVGIDVGAMKAIETGVGPAGPQDAMALRAAAADSDPLEDVCPLRFALPAAPEVAATHEGRKVDLEQIDDAFARIAARHAAVIVEGAGGLLVPTQKGANMADLARRLRLPLVVVARAALGTINHTLLTLEAARARGLDIAGVVISHAEGTLSSADEANLALLRQDLADQLIGEIPHLRSPRQVEPSLFRLEALLRRLR
ncbi:MAG: dethiobiotin synthase [Myxococcota bacterium]